MNSHHRLSSSAIGCISATRSWRSSGGSLLGLWCLLFVLLAVSGAAWSQPTSPGQTPAGLVNLDGLRSGASVPMDMATAIFSNLFGDIFNNPFTSVGGASTLFGVVSLAFNVVVFSAGVVWATYGQVAGVVQSAHEGVVLGKRMSAIWMPIRMVTGIGSLVPAFGGFSLSQVVMIFAAGWGITFGNYAYKQALEAANNFTPLVNLSISGVTTQNKTAVDLAYAIFEQELCRLDANAFQQAYEAASGFNSFPAIDRVVEYPQVFAAAANGGTSRGHAYGTVRDTGRCGAVGIQFIGSATRGESSWGFRSVGVDYNAISTGVYSRYAANYENFDRSVRLAAYNWARDVATAASNSTAVTVPVPTREIEAATAQYLQSTRAVGDGTESQHGTALKQAAFANMEQFGFLGAGAFYSTMAELNTSIAQANQAVNFIAVAPSLAAEQSDRASSPDRSRFRAAYDAQMARSETSSPQLASAPGGSCVSSAWGWIAGECSLGQTVVDQLLRGMTAGSSVGGENSFRIIDPIIAAKNLGDYLLTGGQALLVMSTGAQWTMEYFDRKKDKGDEGILSSNGGKLNPVAFFLKKVGGAFLSLLPIIAGLMIGLGALLAIYIPMVPFINWVSAIVQYVSTVVEAMAAAPLWSFAHLQPDGEGMGQRTERGYLYLLLMLFTPILMVIGFFAACGLVILTGTAVLWLFIPAMANVQGNSVTGIFSIIGFIFIFFILMNILIQGLFNLTMDLKDDVIGWIGNVGRSQIGRDTESKASNLFVMGGRIASGHAQNMIAGGLKPKEDGARSNGGSGQRNKKVS